MLPTQVKDFPEAAAGEKKQPKRRCCGRGDLVKRLAFGTCLAVGLDSSTVQGMPPVSAFPDSDAEPLKFSAGQETLAAALLELVDSARRIGPFRHDTCSARKGVHAADHCQHAIGLKGRLGQR